MSLKQLDRALLKLTIAPNNKKKTPFLYAIYKIFLAANPTP